MPIASASVYTMSLSLSYLVHKFLLHRFAMIAGLVLFVNQTLAQQPLLDSLTLDTLTAYTSLEEALKNPELVIKLELRKKGLKVFPKEIIQFTNLQYLDLSKNKITDEIN